MQTVTIPMEELAQLLQLQLVEGGRATLNVTGSSMKPMLQGQRDTVFLVPPADPQRGDVILYRRDTGMYVLHRIVRRVDEKELICSGDNQWKPEKVSTEQIMAVVCCFRRNGKQYSIRHKGYRLYVWLWVGIFPLRRPIIAVRRLLGRIYRTLRK